MQDLPGDFGQFFGPGKTSPTMVNIMVVDTSPNGVTLPDDFTDDMRKAVEPPYNVAVDKSALKQLGVKLGDQAVVNGRTVRIADLDGYANSQAPGLVMSRQTQRLMGRANDDQLGLLMVRIKDPAKAELVRDELNALGKDQYRAWTKTELSRATIRDAMSEGLLAIILGFMSVVGFIIGVVITWQSCAARSSPTSRNSPACARSGVSIGDLRAVVMAVLLGRRARHRHGRRADGRHHAGGAIGEHSHGREAGSRSRLPSSSSLSRSARALTLGALKKGEPADLLK